MCSLGYCCLGLMTGKGQGHSIRSNRWNPPNEDYVKINFDTCFLSSQRESFSRAIVRDANGCLLAANTHPHSFVLDQEMAKARSCKQADYLARDLGFRRVIFKGEALNVISQINSSADNFSDISAILENIYKESSHFHSLSFNHVGRNCNETAHTLALECRRFNSQRVWIEEAPTEC
ncbi:hypothetical protein V6N11_043934 [Hibiscus sabdariffa]|uniref:RNase H type-1 domain-containing protein n=2 Tax=Hibiscus sabdariffa TaxID=183260 RepID=A0ABR2REF1_9ROSI